MTHLVTMLTRLFINSFDKSEADEEDRSSSHVEGQSAPFPGYNSRRLCCDIFEFLLRKTVEIYGPSEM